MSCVVDELCITRVVNRTVLLPREVCVVFQDNETYIICLQIDISEVKVGEDKSGQRKVVILPYLTEGSKEF